MASRWKPHRPDRCARRSSWRRQTRRLACELLEPRRLLAQASFVTHTFREDNYSLSGTFSYVQRSPQDHDYIDSISSGRYSSSSGQIKWNSATEGTGFLIGTATGDGRDTVVVGHRRNCSEYGIEDKGRFDFTLDAATSTLRMGQAEATSTRYTYYRDLLGGNCPQPNPPWSRFFGGVAQSYTGTFSSETHKVGVRYDSTSPDVHVEAPASALAWSNAAATDLVLTAVPIPSVLSVPNGYVGVAQSSQPPATLSYLDPINGGLAVTLRVTGQPLSTTTPQTPVAAVRAFWASSGSDTSGTEIPIQSASGAVGVFWNSSQLSATIRQFSTPPANARFIRLTVTAPAGADANSANSTVYLPLGEFQALDFTRAATDEDQVLDGSLDSVLHPNDRSDPSVRVFAYRPASSLGGVFSVFQDIGSFSYDPTRIPAVQALGVGQSLTDTVQFLAVKDQTLLDVVTLTIPIHGANDEPSAELDRATATNFHRSTMPVASLLANDSDLDQGDQVRFLNVGSTSSLGATIRTELNDAQTAVERIIFDPTSSTALRELATGAVIQDEFTYEIVDRSGAVGIGIVMVEVTGEERILTIAPPSTQYTTTGLATGLIPVTIEDPDGDPSDIQLTVTIDNSALIPASGIQTESSGGVFSVTLTPAPAANGLAWVTLDARDSIGKTASQTFLLVVGGETDLDWDGVPNEMEDAAPQGGDMNQDGVPDSQQVQVVSLRAAPADPFVNVTVADTQALVLVQLMNGPPPAGPASGAELPLGLLEFEIAAATAGESAMLSIHTGDSTMALNRIFEYDGFDGAGEPGGTAAWRPFMHDKRDGAKVFGDRIEIRIRDGGRGDATSGADRRIGTVIGLAKVARPWQNLAREDVDNDGTVAPLDVLILINQLNQFGSRSLGDRPVGSQVLPNFLDPTGNNSLEPLDALLVINFLNNRTNGTEGESAGELLTGVRRELPLERAVLACGCGLNEIPFARHEIPCTERTPPTRSKADAGRRVPAGEGMYYPSRLDEPQSADRRFHDSFLSNNRRSFAVDDLDQFFALLDEFGGDITE